MKEKLIKERSFHTAYSKMQLGNFRIEGFVLMPFLAVRIWFLKVTPFVFTFANLRQNPQNWIRRREVCCNRSINEFSKAFENSLRIRCVQRSSRYQDLQVDWKRSNEVFFSSLNWSCPEINQNLILHSHFLELTLFQTKYLELILCPVSLLIYIWVWVWRICNRIGFN